MVSVLTPTPTLLLSFSRFIWPLVSFSPHTARSRCVSARLAPGCRVCLQVYSGLNRWRWVTCLWRSPLARPRGNLSRPDWRVEAPGPAIVLAGGEGLWCEAPALCCRATGGSRLSLGVGAFGMTQIFRNRTLWNLRLITLEGTDTRNVWHNCPSDRNTHWPTLCVCLCVCAIPKYAIQTGVKKRCISQGVCLCGDNELFLTQPQCWPSSLHVWEKSHPSLWCQTRHGKLSWEQKFSATSPNSFPTVIRLPILSLSIYF